MTLLQTFEDQEYLPEYGTLVVRDAGEPDARVELASGEELLEEYATAAQPGGTIAHAGYGWLQASAGDGYQVVRLEAHDGAPPDDRSAWDGVVETPYRSWTGSVGLTYVTSGSGNADLRLGPPGSYRVRVSRRPADIEGDLWRLQFWPAPGVPEPPRWLARRDPATGSGRSGWEEVLGHEAAELAFVVGSAATPEAGATVEQLQEWCIRHGRGAGWLDEPPWPDPPAPLPTGHADLDADAEQRWRSALAAKARNVDAVAGVAAQLGVPAPTTRRGLLAVLVAAGILATDDSRGPRRYHPVAEPRRARQVLRLPPEQVAALERQDAFQRYTSLASDVASVVMWAPVHPAVVSVQGLADRLLATHQEVRATLGHAVDVGLLNVDGDLADPAAPVALRLLPSRRVESSQEPVPKQGPPWGRSADAAEAHVAVVAVRNGGDGEQHDGDRVPSRPPLGVPPRAGFVGTNGDVVVWRDNAPVVVYRSPGVQPYRAMQSAHGIVLLGLGDRAVLLRPNGHVDTLGADLAPRAALGEDGRYLAVDESHLGRRSWSRLHLVDLADGSRQTMPWDEEDVGRFVVAVDGGAVYFQSGHARLASMRWSPGSDPELLEHRLREIDPLTGTRLADDDDPGVLVVRPDGTSRRVLIDPAVALAPGGERLYAYRYSPPAVTLFDVAAGAEDPRVFWLPPGSLVSTTAPGQPVWEDPDHLVVLLQYPDVEFDAPTVRLDVRTGEVERVPLTEDAGYRPLLIQPLLRHARA